jgi:hypothetical protein
LTKSVLALALLGLLPMLATAQVTYPVRDVLFVNYFSNALGVVPSEQVVQPGPEQKVRILNPGLYQGVVAYQTTGNLCAFIYVFDRNQQLLECCGCLVTPNGVRELSVNFDLTDNPLTGGSIQDGGIKIVSHPQNGAPPKFSNGDRCNPTSITKPEPTLRAWITHLQDDLTSLTEEEFLEAPLSVSEVRRLQGRCRFIFTNASGSGICSCGAGGVDDPYIP